MSDMNFPPFSAPSSSDPEKSRDSSKTGRTPSEVEVDAAGRESLKKSQAAGGLTSSESARTSERISKDGSSPESLDKIRAVQKMRLQAIAPHLTTDEVAEIYEHVDKLRDNKLQEAKRSGEDVSIKGRGVSIVFTPAGGVRLHTAGRIINLDTGKLVGSKLKDAAPHLTPTKIKEIYKHVDTHRAAHVHEAQLKGSPVTEGNAYLSISYDADGTVRIITEGRAIDFDSGEIMASHLQRNAPQLSVEDLRLIYAEIDENRETKLAEASTEQKQVNVDISDKVRVSYTKDGAVQVRIAGRVIDFQTGEIVRSNLEKKLPGLGMEDIRKVYAHIDANKIHFLAAAKQSGKSVQVNIESGVLSYNADQSITLTWGSRTIDVESRKDVGYKLAERAPQLSEKSIRKIYDYVDKNRALLLERARLKGGDLYIRAGESGLARTLQVTKEGQVFVLLNRKKLGDTHLGTGAEKVVTLAVDLETGKLFASAGLRAIDPAELEMLKEFSQENGFVKLYRDVAYQGKSGTFQKRRLIMELCSAGDLQKPLVNLEQAKPAIFEGVIGAVARMHAKGYVHRDLKPANVLLSKDKEDTKIEAVVADLGFACRQDDTDEVVQPCGTPLYLSPEYVREGVKLKRDRDFLKVTTPAHDVWALGCTLAEVVGVTLPWSGVNMQELYSTLANLKQSDLPEPRPINSPQHLVWEMLQVNPNDRITAEAASRKLAQLRWV